MARRKRLSVEAGAGAAADAAPRRAAPIAQTAGEAAASTAAEIARLQAAAQAGASAEAEGRLLLDLPLDAIAVDYLPRDRMEMVDEDEAFRALKASIAEAGQRVPVELVRLAPDRYGLVAGLRRLQALQTLHWETGEARFATVRAIVRAEGDRQAALRAMVEENEIRADLSQYERGRVCARAAEAGIFADAEAAVEALFAAASASRRSKIRSFLAVHRGLGDLLAYPEQIPERLGLELAKALKWGRGPALRAQLAGKATTWAGAEDELAALRAALADPGSDPATPATPAAPDASDPAAQTGRGSGRVGSRRSPDPGRRQVVELANGLRIERRSFGTHTDLRLSGPDLDEDLIEAAMALLANRLGR